MPYTRALMEMKSSMMGFVCLVLPTLLIVAHAVHQSLDRDEVQHDGVLPTLLIVAHAVHQSLDGDEVQHDGVCLLVVWTVHHDLPVAF